MLSAKACLDDLRISAHFLWRSFGDDAALGEPQHPGAQRHHEFHVVLDHHEGGALHGVDLAQPLAQAGEHGRVDAAGRHVEQLLLAVAQAAGFLLRERAEAKEFDHPVGCFAEASVAPSNEAPPHRLLVFLPGEDQVLAHRQLREHLQQLEGAADPEAVELAGPHAGDAAAVDAHLPRRRRELAEDAVEQRRLSRAVRPDQAEDLALAHVEGDAVDRAYAAERLGKIAYFQDGIHLLRTRWASPSRPDGQNAIRTITAIAYMMR